MWNLNLLLSILMASTNCKIGKKFVMHLFWFHVNGLFLMDKYYKSLPRMFSGTCVDKLSTSTSFIYSTQINESTNHNWSNYDISEIIPYFLMIFKTRLAIHCFVERQQKIPTISGPIFFIYAINATKLKYRWYHLRGFWPLPKPSRFLISKPHSSPNFTMSNEAKVLQLFLNTNGICICDIVLFDIKYSLYDDILFN